MQSRSIRRTLIAAIALATTAQFCFAAEPAAPKKITSVEGITEYRLDNGLQVLLFPDDSKPTVTVNATYFVGSRHEGYGETGMAHLLEHMVFKGTPDHPQIWKLLQDHGAQFNGSTSFDRTNYFETMAATDENLEFGLSLEADRMVNSRIAAEDLSSEFSVVRNEFEMGENNPLGVLQERIWSTAYLWHNYGKSTIGSREDIERVPVDRLKAFYQKFYQPDNAMLVVAGKFDPEKTLKRINELFGAIPRPTRKLDPTYTVEPAQDGEREVILRRVGEVQAIGAAYHICAGSHDDMAPLEVLAHLMDATQTGRLYKALVETKMATRVSASAESLFDPGIIQFDAEVAVDKPMQPVREKMLDVIEGLAAEEITQEEVDRAKNAYDKQFEMVMGNSGRVGIFMSEWAAQGDWRLMFFHRDRLKKVTVDDVKRVAATYLKKSNRTVGVFVPTTDPDRTKVPATPDILAMLKDYKGNEAIAAGEAFEATPENIEARTTRGTLSNGVKTALLPKRTRGERCVVELTLHYGSEALLKNRTTAASFVSAMLERGTKKHTRRELQDEFDKLKASVRVGNGGGGGGGGRAGRMMGGGGGAPGTLSVSIDTTKENLPAVIALVGEMLREPAFPESEFDTLKQQIISGIEQSRSEPAPQAGLALRRKMAPFSAEDIRYVPTIDEQLERIKALKLADIKKLYEDLIGGSYGELAAVGDFDPAALTSSFDKILTGWKTPKPFERITMPFNAVSADSIEIDTPDKAMAFVLLGTTVEIRDDDPAYPAMMMANFILGGNSNSRLLNRLRQKEGLSYGCGSTFSASSLDKNGAMMAFGICAATNAKKAADIAAEEVAKFLKDGITQKELDDAKKGYMEEVKVQLSSDPAVVSMLGDQLYLDRTMKFSQERIAKIAELTVDEINAAIKKYVNGERLIRVRAGDMKSEKK